MVEDVLRVRPKLVKDIITGRITSGAQLRMRFELAGTEPDSDFLFWMLHDSDHYPHTGVHKIMVDCIEHGYFVDLFREWGNFNQLVSMLSSVNDPLVPRKILNALCRKSPGIVIGHYLKHSEILVKHRRMSDLVPFENTVIKLAKKLSEESPDFKEMCYPKIIKTFERNRTMELAMG